MPDQLCLMQVHAHPDDEASKGAATTARYASEGAKNVLVTCTGGEAGEILNPAADTPENRADLFAVRMRELDESVEILGYDSLHLLGYRDSGMPDSEENKHPDAFANADFEEAVGKLVAVIRAERPQVILCYGDDQSSYPHPDHIRSHEITVVAFDAAGNPQRFPDAGEPFQPSKLYYMTWSVARMRAMHECCVKLGVESWYADRIKDARDDSDARITTRIDIGKWIPLRSAALRAHATQVAPDSFWFAVPDEMIVDAYPWDEYILARSLVGNPEPGALEDDLFVGLR